MPFKRALVRRPGPLLRDGIVTHIGRSPIDVDAAESQWRAYVAALDAEDWATIEVESADDCPDAVFVEDGIVVYDELAVITRPGARQRRPETAGTEAAARDAGYRIERIAAPGTLDGGDVLKVGTTVLVGQGGRTNADGIRQLGDLLRPLGVNVTAIPVTKVLHLKSAVTALPDGTVIGYPPLVDDVTAFEEFLPVPEESGAHVVLLDDETLLMAASAPQTQRLLERRGYRIVSVDISEFEKLEGCVTCLSVRLRH